MKELVIISFLYSFDFVMNIITLGQWGQVRGNQQVIYKVREQV